MNFDGLGVTASVSIRGDTAEASWYDIWASLYAITNLCLDKGKAGMARLGEFLDSLVRCTRESLTATYTGDEKNLFVSIT